MGKLLNLGFKKFQITENTYLEFNPSDAQIYTRYGTFDKKMRTTLKEYTAKLEKENITDVEVAETINKFDVEVKKQLGNVFGKNNNFHKILHGLNLFSMVDDKGTLLIEELGEVLSSILDDTSDYYVDGIESRAKEERKKAEQRRKQRGQ